MKLISSNQLLNYVTTFFLAYYIIVHEQLHLTPSYSVYEGFKVYTKAQMAYHKITASNAKARAENGYFNP